MNHPEYNACVQLHRWLKWRDIKHTHVPNEGNGDYRRGAMNKAIGVSPGFPDYLIYLNENQTRTGERIKIALEMKRPDKTGRASPEQIEWLGILDDHGYRSGVANGVEEAVEFIIACGYDDSNDIPDPKCPF